MFFSPVLLLVQTVQSLRSVQLLRSVQAVQRDKDSSPSVGMTYPTTDRRRPTTDGAGGRRSEVRVQKSEVRGQKSEIRGQKSENFRALCSYPLALRSLPWPEGRHGGLP